jgi:hypothetical protein
LGKRSWLVVCEWGNEIVVNLPDDIDPERKSRKVSLDSCIAEVIQRLWKQGCQIRSCCCGHGKENASIVISGGYDEEGVRRIADFLKKHDDKSWSIEQWRLVTVAMTLPVSHP